MTKTIKVITICVITNKDLNLKELMKTRAMQSVPELIVNILYIA